VGKTAKEGWEEEGKEGGRERTYLGEVNALRGVVLGNFVDLRPPIGRTHVLQLVLLLELWDGRKEG